VDLVADASALVAWLMGEAAAGEVEDLLGRERVLCSASNLAEVAFRISRSERLDPVAVEALLADLRTVGLVVVPVDADLAVRAASIRAAHYHRTRMAVSLADCVALATAAAIEAPLVTSDAALCRVAAAVGVAVVPIPNSKGVRPRVHR
jgi:PIN domain nuclease of toxin-antitoxin system